ncbi:MAG TPA: hypothetical protein EYQ00_02760 [Dehalococcoidia bacterium]|nr:hypothetical protein [Dehalococcoidia bacterium]
MAKFDIPAIIKTFPETFGLRAFPGRSFYISEMDSFEVEDELRLYVFTQEKGLAFAKTSPEELRQEIVLLA